MVFLNRPVLNREDALSPCLPGFEHVVRRWDKKHQRVQAKVGPGEFYVTDSNEVMMTVLGSCISVCIRDAKVGVAGMNHFLLPVQGEHMAGDTAKAGTGASSTSVAARYGNWSMEYLINGILKLGGRKSNFEVKIFGGGAVLDMITSFSVGDENICFVDDYLKREGLVCVGRDVGGEFPRKILYYPDTGVVKVKKLREEQFGRIQTEESQYVKTLQRSDDAGGGDIELFD